MFLDLLQVHLQCDHCVTGVTQSQPIPKLVLIFFSHSANKLEFHCSVLDISLAKEKNWSNLFPF